MASNGASKLAQVIAERITFQAQRPDALELGVIQSDMSLKLDRCAVPIPQGQYLIASWKFSQFDGNQILAPGDRVLIAWVNDGVDPIVLSKVVSS